MLFRSYLVKKSEIEHLSQKKNDENLKEYVDPIYYVKNKLKGKTKVYNKPYELDNVEYFQEIIDWIFNKISKEKKLEHLKGFEVVSATKFPEMWGVWVRPIVDDYFNWRDNPKFLEKLKEIQAKFEKFIVPFSLLDLGFKNGATPDKVQLNWFYQ